MARQHKWAIQCHSRWFTLENTGQKTKNTQSTQTKHNAEKANNIKHDTRPWNNLGLFYNAP